jgi:hypothetical protein
VERSDAPRQVPELDLFEPGLGNHRGELALRRKAANTLDEVSIGVSITGHDLPEQRHDLKAVEIVERLKEWGYFGCEFEG